MRQKDIHGTVNVRNLFQVLILNQLNNDRPSKTMTTTNSIFFRGHLVWQGIVCASKRTSEDMKVVTQGLLVLNLQWKTSEPMT